MAYVKKYRPAYFSGFPDENWEVANFEELNKLPVMNFEGVTEYLYSLMGETVILSAYYESEKKNYVSCHITGYDPSFLQAIKETLRPLSDVI